MDSKLYNEAKKKKKWVTVPSVETELSYYYMIAFYIVDFLIRIKELQYLFCHKRYIIIIYILRLYIVDV